MSKIFEDYTDADINWEALAVVLQNAIDNECWESESELVSTQLLLKAVNEGRVTIAKRAD